MAFEPFNEIDLLEPYFDPDQDDFDEPSQYDLAMYELATIAYDYRFTEVQTKKIEDILRRYILI